MKTPRPHIPRRTTTAATLAVAFVVALLGDTTTAQAQARARANSCNNQEADCTSMANSIARRSFKSGVKSIVCTSANTATVKLDNGFVVQTGWLGGFATGAVLDGFSGLHFRNCAFTYTCPHSGIQFNKVFCTNG
ncbi:MAG: hypothetical protein ACRBN8_01275 [Nannocystales bacterium]